jgi:hypothetical protein
MGYKTLIASIFFLILTPPVFCQARQDTKVQNRRIEEEKRADLKPTQKGRLPESKEEEAEPTDLSGFNYFRHLITKNVAQQGDACMSVAVMLNIDDEAGDLDSQIKALNERGIIPKKIAADFDPSQPLRKGVAAHMFCKALGIKGGVVLRLFGVSQRYALKELVFENIMFPGYDRDLVSGKELVLILTEAVNYLAAKQGKTQQD